MAKAIAVVISMLLIFHSDAYAQSGCAKDSLGRVFCAPAGGSAVDSLTGVACAPGRCIADDLGYLKCSSEKGGGAIKDDLGRVVCVGGCISPSKEYCIDMKKGEKN